MNRIKLAPVILSTLMVFTGFQLQAQDGGSSSAVLPDVVLLWALISVAALLVLVNFVILSTIKGIAADRGVWEVVREKLDRSKGGAAILFLGLMLSGFSANAADGSTEIPFVMSDDLFYALLGINALLLGLVFYQISVLRAIINLMKSEEEVKETLVESWTASLVDVVPIEQEEEIMFEHEHDGIRELDNNLPPWWLYGFYFTIVFAVFYTVHFLITPVPGLDIVFGPGIEQEEMYEIEMAEAEEAKAAYLAQLSNLIDENNVEAKLDPATLAEGQEIWIANCANCHRADGGGDVGPNMTDAYWLHGGGIQNIFKTVKYGVDGKGMIAWEGQLSPGQMQSVASYVLSLGGTTPEIAKEPQGEIWEAPAAQPENEAAMDSTATAAEEVPEDIPQDDVPTEDNQTDQ